MTKSSLFLLISVLVPRSYKPPCAVDLMPVHIHSGGGPPKEGRPHRCNDRVEDVIQVSAGEKFRDVIQLYGSRERNTLQLCLATRKPSRT